MFGAGVVEGFFGPEWSWQSRREFCRNIKSYQGDFYIYAPKRDPFLRKSWMRNHPAETWTKLQDLRKICHQSQIKFGVGLSPFEIHEHWGDSAKKDLREKVLKLGDLGIDYLGLFFDDMRGAPDLAEKQVEIVDFVRQTTAGTIWFCPTYYSPDPILDKVFGQRPPQYLEKIGKNISLDVAILWTGSKVISPVITAEELQEVEKILRRKPFLWDNYFANDGPKQCKFLRLKPFEGRPHGAFAVSSGWSLNLMNQPHLSAILFAASMDVLKKNLSPMQAFQTRLEQMAGKGFAQMVTENQASLLELGLDQMSPEATKKLRGGLNPQSPFEKDVLDWLAGQYIVGPECLTD